MFCHHCENVLNLDILLSTHPSYHGNEGQSRPYPHHESFSAIEQSAKGGCELCQIVSSHPMRNLFSDKPATWEDARMYFEFNAEGVVNFTNGLWRKMKQKRAWFGIRFTPSESKISV